MSWLEVVVLGLVQGLTEFLPISSSAHLRIVSGVFFGNDPGAAFTAVSQLGTEAAVLIYFARDIAQLVAGWVRGLMHREERAETEYRLAWLVIIGTVPISVLGLLFKDQIETTLRSLWFVGAALIAFSGVMWFADRAATQQRHEAEVTWKDTLIIGTAQALALIPGISRSGATMSAGLLRDFDRVTVTRLSFFLSIPALLAAGVLQIADEHDNIATGVGWPATITATLVSGAVGYLAVAWLLKFVARHTYTVFIVYRVVLGTLLLVLVGTGTIEAT